MTRMDGAMKTISIIVITAIALGSILWGLSDRSGNLERVIEDVAELEIAFTMTSENVIDVEKAIILIQSDMGYMKTDIASILTTQEAILGKLE